MLELVRNKTDSISHRNQENERNVSECVGIEVHQVLDKQLCKSKQLLIPDRTARSHVFNQPPE